MNNQNDDCDSLNFSPDPTWDYYLLWCQLQRIKAQIDMASIVIGQVECANTATDNETRRLLLKPFEGLENILDQFHPDGDEEVVA
ncbi:MAG: hypothetical protein V7K67_07545 [Nostoc sp.]|uniref:hypothetical protein n=1 Tax=Nostoc sp. TaxID=1180 RepID=UPI002FF9C356